MEDKKKNANKKLRTIAGQWAAFSRTEAYQELMEYIDMQDEFAIAGAKGPVMPFGGEDGQQFTFDGEKAASLLQRSVGYDIVKTYIDGYVNLDVEQLKITT